MDIKQLESIAAALKAAFPVVGFGGWSVYDVPREQVHAIGRLPGASRYTCKYEAKPDKPAYAIEAVYIYVDGVKFEAHYDRPLVDGESLEQDWRTQQQRDADERAEEERKRAVVVVPPRPVVCGESRWSWLEVD
jgi:hypothetical protein